MTNLPSVSPERRVPLGRFLVSFKSSEKTPEVSLSTGAGIPIFLRKDMAILRGRRVEREKSGIAGGKK